MLGAGKVDANGNFTAMSLGDVLTGYVIGSDAAGRVYLANHPVNSIVLTMLDTSGKVLAVPPPLRAFISC